MTKAEIDTRGWDDLATFDTGSNGPTNIYNTAIPGFRADLSKLNGGSVTYVTDHRELYQPPKNSEALK